MKPDLRDVHVYGGLLVMAAGIEHGLWGIALVGVCLAYLGVFRMGPPPKEGE